MSKAGKGGKNAPKVRGWTASDYETTGMKADEIEEIKEAFDIFDNDLSGAISVAELTSSFKSLGFDVAHSNVYEILKDLDKDGNGEIDFTEFLDLLSTKLSAENTREEIEKVFKMFDADRTGEISVENLMQVARTLGDDISPENLASVLQTSDVDQDGRLTFEDFYAIMTRASVEDRAAMLRKAEAEKPKPKPEKPKVEAPRPVEAPVHVEGPKPVEAPVLVEAPVPVKDTTEKFENEETRPETEMNTPINEGPSIPDSENFAMKANGEPEQYRFQMIGRYMSAGNWNDMTFKKIFMDDSGKLEGRGSDAMGFWSVKGEFIQVDLPEEGGVPTKDYMELVLHKEYKDAANVNIRGHFDPIASLMVGQWWPEGKPETTHNCQVKMGAPVWTGTQSYRKDLAKPEEEVSFMFAIEAGKIVGYGVDGEEFDGDDFYTIHGGFDFAAHTVRFVCVYHATGVSRWYEGETRVDGSSDIIYGAHGIEGQDEPHGEFEIRYKHKSGFIDW
jgi:Ca2+-binding EF-hand superfamily protein